MVTPHNSEVHSVRYKTIGCTAAINYGFDTFDSTWHMYVKLICVYNTAILHVQSTIMYTRCWDSYLKNICILRNLVTLNAI